MREANQKKEKAITLIALVITIIVLLILAGISIAMLTGENGILSKANNAKILTVEAEEIEQIKLAYNIIKTDKMHKGDKTVVTIAELEVEFETQKIEATIEENSEPIKITFTKTGNQYTLDTSMEEIEKIGSGQVLPKEKSELVKAKEAQTVFETETPLKDEWENIVVVPKGFKISEDSGDDVTQGVVIEDVVKEGTRKGSQFVWIPIGTIKGENGKSEEIELGRYGFEEDGTPIAYTGSNLEETATNTLNKGNIIAKDIEAFKTSVATKGGYYIGRYEAGIENGNLNLSGMSVNNTVAPNNDWTGWTGDLVCKKECQVWNYITQRRAASLARNMYSDGEGFTSDLMNSYAWDTAVLFIEKFSGDTDYARQTNLRESVTKTGEGQDLRCNIYDMAGNTQEWITETHTDRDERCVLRGGCCERDYYTSFRNDNGWLSAHQIISFRVVFYLV